MFGIACAIPPQPRLFPNCLCMPGWQHGWDTVLRRGLRSLRFFPTWITMMRGLVNFMRSPLLLDALVRHVCSAGFPIIAEMLSDCKGKVPSIAEWRWGTLLAAMEALHGILNTLRSHFAEKLYKNVADPSKIKAARAALYSIAFKWQFNFIMWYAQWLCRIAAWGKCTGRKMDDGTPDTSWNGRRLPEAESYITEKLSSALQEANGWTTGTWGCTADELSELQECVRGTYHLAWLRHEYLKKRPWRFCRVHEPGMAAKVI